LWYNIKNFKFKPMAKKKATKKAKKTKKAEEKAKKVVCEEK
jgi:hypothetical protein